MDGEYPKSFYQYAVYHRRYGADRRFAGGDNGGVVPYRWRQFHGGFGFAAEYDVERKFRETRLYQVAPISTNLILSYVAEHILGLPRSF